MCSSTIFGATTTMDNYQVGDLTDILLRATGGAGGGGGGAAASYGTTSSSSSEAPPPPPPPSASSSSHHNQYPLWQQQQQQQHFSCVPVEDQRGGGATDSIFGDPFSTMRDPFLHELHIPPTYFNAAATGLDEAAAATFTAPPPPPNTTTIPPSIFAQQSSDRPRPPSKNIFSNMIQISPNNANLLPSLPSMAAAAASNSSPRAAAPLIKPPPPPSAAAAAINMVNNANSSSGKDSSSCLLDNSSLQISSPRNPALKRRKNQAKKVVCIPAPAAANNRQTGEVVPSDLWAWRKYGQKPIKGSPYPRGYYRCSSSKGCSARKQVERSRTDPNMLVITYTSEHNHPWPTQRNALAGSTRSQPSKNNNNNNNAASASASSKNSDISQQHQKGIIGTPTTTAATTTTNNNNNDKAKGEEQQESNNNSEGNVSIKEEMEEEMQLEMDDDVDGEFSTYKPSMMMEGNNSQSHNHEDFFAELGEIEADPLNLLFSQGFNGGDKTESKALDPFSLFDWSGDTNNSFEEPNTKGRL